MSGHNQNDTLINSAMLARSVRQIMKRVRLDRGHDIPYLAGYSANKPRIYIDRHVPRSFTDHRGSRHRVDPFLILHEATEKALIDMWALHYQHAHQIALRAEEAAVRAVGIRWRDYNRFMQKSIKRADSEKLTRVPRDLDLTPYVDEGDRDLIKVMKRAMQRQGPR